MGSDRARVSYEANKQYRAVVAQQGRVTLEADWNEAQEISGEELRQETLDFVGPMGTPDDGYRILQPTTPVKPPFDFSVQGGTMYVGGVRAFLGDAKHPGAARRKFQRRYFNQSDWLDYEGDPDWVKNPTAEREFVYLALREQEISAVEDEDLLEQALGGPDTTQRTRLIQHIVRLATTAESCETALEQAIQHWQQAGLRFDESSMRLLSATSLKVSFTHEKPEPKPCDPDTRGGYLEADNQLIRVQIASYNPSTKKYTLVWGFDNASSLYQIQVINKTTLKLLKPLPVDDFHNPKSDQVVEVLRSAAQLSSTAYAASATGYVKGIDSYDPNTSTMTLDISTPLTDEESQFLNKNKKYQTFARIWEEAIEIAASPQPVTVKLKQTRLQVTLRTTANQPFHIGDYWMIAVRPGAPTEQAQIYPTDYLKRFRSPDGPRLWVSPLAVLHWQKVANGNSRTLTVRDCRDRFNNLVELSRQLGTGCCTVLVRPEAFEGYPTLQELLNSYKNKGSVTICLSPGIYNLPEPLRLDSGHSGLTLQGCQDGVVLKAAAGSEKEFLDGLIVLVGAERVTLRRLQFHIPTVPFVAAGGQLTGVTKEQLQQWKETVGGDVGVCIGVRPVQCSQLAIEDCQFRFLSDVTRGKLPATLRELELAGIWGVGIFAASDCLGLTVHRNHFLAGQNGNLQPDGQPPLNLMGYVLVPSIISAAQPPARVVLSKLDDASFRDNEFNNLILATLIDAETGSVQVSGNKVQECYTGFWFLSLRTLATGTTTLEELQRELTGAGTQIIQLLQRLLETIPEGNQLALLILVVILVTLFFNPVLTLPILIALNYPLPTELAPPLTVTVPDRPDVAVNRATEAVRSIWNRVNTAFTEDNLNAAGVAIPDLQTVVPMMATFPINPRYEELIPEIARNAFSVLAALGLAQPALKLNLDFSHNQVDTQVINGSALGNALVIWDLDQQTDSIVTLSDNQLINRASQPLLIPTALILLVDRVTITGNLIINEWQWQAGQFWPLSLVLLPGGPLPPSPKEIDANPAVPYNPLVAITGNVFKGFPILPPRPTSPVNLTNWNWYVLNTISL